MTTTTAPTTSQSSADPDASPWAQAHRALADIFTAPDGFAAITALHWIEADPAPVDGIAGSWRTDGDHVVVTGLELTDEAGAPVTADQTLEVPEAGALWVGHAGEVKVQLIRRTGRYAVRLFDATNPDRELFASPDLWPTNPALVLVGDYRPDPTTIVVAGAQPGLQHLLSSPGEVTLELDGRTAVLRTTGEGRQQRIPFFDPTNRRGSADWRVVAIDLDADADQPQQVSVDFNRATNFPAALNNFGTCPQPPVGNRLASPITAGARDPRLTRQAAANGTTQETR